MGNLCTGKKGIDDSSSVDLNDRIDNLPDEDLDLVYTSCPDEVFGVAAFSQVDVAGVSAAGAKQPEAGGEAAIKTNQDGSLVAAPVVSDDRGYWLFGVFDGHGYKGEEISQFASKKLQAAIEKKIKQDKMPLSRILNSSFTESDGLVHRDATFSGLGYQGTGTTATVAVLQGSQLTVGWVGDSRAVLATRIAGAVTAKELSTDHKPEDPAEKARIESKGGYVIPANHNGVRGPARVCFSDKGDGPGLAMSRSLGDRNAKKNCGVTAIPDVLSHSLSSDDVGFVLASDGVWEHVSSQEAALLISKHSSALAAATALVQLSAKRWRGGAEQTLTYRDDITAVVVLLAAATSTTTTSAAVGTTQMTSC